MPPDRYEYCWAEVMVGPHSWGITGGIGLTFFGYQMRAITPILGRGMNMRPGGGRFSAGGAFAAFPKLSQLFLGGGGGGAAGVFGAPKRLNGAFFGAGAGVGGGAGGGAGVGGGGGGLGSPTTE